MLKSIDLNQSWHSLPAEKVLDILRTGQNGLSEEEVRARLEQFGYNVIAGKKRKSALFFLIKQFKSLLVIILFAAAFISFLAGHIVDVYIILAVAFANAVLGFFQEYKADKAVEALKKMVRHNAKVLRKGVYEIVSSEELVPGDVIILEEGDNITADARLIFARNLKCVEASLTGESLPVSKDTRELPGDIPLADRRNMLWKGTFTAGGYARAVVTGTGMTTAFGKIAESLIEIKETKTNFSRKTDLLARQMGIIAISSASLLFAVGYFFRDFDFMELLLISIAALVSAIPEGLPAVISVVLAIGAKRISNKNAIIREFTATETLGAVSAILTDKTGTLTQNVLTVEKIYVPGEPDIDVSGEGLFPAGNLIQEGVVLGDLRSSALMRLLKIAAYSNNSCIQFDKVTGRFTVLGDPTEGAILVLVNKTGDNITAETAERTKIDDQPFDSALKYRATLIKEDSHKELLVVGAPEVLLARSAYINYKYARTALTEEERDSIEAKILRLSAQAYRVIGLAYKIPESGGCRVTDSSIDNLVFAGLIGMKDPPRPGAKESVEKCRKAGIKVIMATGDHINTAIAIAKETSIITPEQAGAGKKVLALTERQLEMLDGEEFDEAIRNVSVFARLTPGMKLKIAGRLQELGYLIAMTGDGVNDAPALKKADVGVSMGIMGTDVAREASRIILADDNFSTIVNAIEEGRIVFTNARQTSFYLVTTNFAEILTLVTIISIGFPAPLTATQILWLNLVTDGCMDVPLATEKGHGDALEEKPLGKKENILNKKILPFLIINASVMTALSVAFFLTYIPEGLDKARTMVFLVMTFTQLFNVFNMRSLKKSIFEVGLFTNMWVNAGFLFSFILLYLILNLEFFRNLFSFSAVTAVELAVLITLASCTLWAGELYKFFVRRKSMRR